MIRDAWDTGRLRTLTKHDATRATGAHINIIGHTTREELRRLMTETEQANGFANRILWCCTRRSKLLPDGGNLPDGALACVTDAIRDAAKFASYPGRMQRSEHASALWHEVYPTLAADRAGMLGAATNRAEAQALRLSLLYALLDSTDEIGETHLRAALECWRYCEQSAAYAFGCGLGDATADELLAMLRAVLPAGMSREEISAAFSRNKTASEIRRALGVLRRNGLATPAEDRSTGGRPREIWIARPTK